MVKSKIVYTYEGDALAQLNKIISLLKMYTFI